MVINGKKEKQVCRIDNCRGCNYGNVLPSETEKASIWDIIDSVIIVVIIIILIKILL